MRLLQFIACVCIFLCCLSGCNDSAKSKLSTQKSPVSASSTLSNKPLIMPPTFRLDGVNSGSLEEKPKKRKNNIHNKTLLNKQDALLVKNLGVKRKVKKNN